MINIGVLLWLLLLTAEPESATALPTYKHSAPGSVLTTAPEAATRIIVLTFFKIVNKWKHRVGN